MTSEELIASERISWLEEQAEIRAPAHAFKALGGRTVLKDRVVELPTRHSEGRQESGVAG
jgi:hypothetical protein